MRWMSLTLTRGHHAPAIRLKHMNWRPPFVKSEEMTTVVVKGVRPASESKGFLSVERESYRPFW
ncbi:protein of unknown function [Pseudodesulfovibrio piezophilus C1TLV30]|uniref:Uncharacterized protein n=1 Tax=Pseudodesulfovibrio piezophilus (strain DSM 21447 / JCM 15486 / C1TLV30) TaxID=1322246 RepID=M1WLU4_PSEP2|nr:protein of unknown function [Pseudodesulfovibrio piezophilus C1TLV30]